MLQRTIGIDTYRYLDDLGKAGPRGFQNSPCVLAHLVRLLRSGTSDELPVCLRGNLTRNKDKPIGFDGLRVWTNGYAISTSHAPYAESNSGTHA